MGGCCCGGSSDEADDRAFERKPLLRDTDVHVLPQQEHAVSATLSMPVQPKSLSQSQQSSLERKQSNDRSSPRKIVDIKAPSPVNRGSLKDLQELAKGLAFDESPEIPDVASAVVRAYSVAEDPNPRGLAKAKATKGQGLVMEDRSVAEFPLSGTDSTRALFAVFDGHAGHRAAEFAKQNIARLLTKNLLPLTDPAQLREILRTTFLELDKEMLEFEYEGCTATVAVLLTHNNTKYLQVANVGDSSAFLCRATGDVSALTQIHHLAEDYERNRVQAMGINVTPRQTRILGLGVSRALGDHFPKSEKAGLIGEPYVSELIRIDAETKWLVIASDGLWDVMSAGRAAQLLLTSGSAAEGAQALLASAMSNSKCTDNVTVIAVMLN